MKYTITVIRITMESNCLVRFHSETSLIFRNYNFVTVNLRDQHYVPTPYFLSVYLRFHIYLRIY
jgi:hypothetical protein